MNTRRINNEVLVVTDPIVKIARQDIDALRQIANETQRRRARYCAHRVSDDPLHEMMILLDRATYVQPHKHRNKSESFHVMEGALDVIVFDDEGGLVDVISMGDYESGRVFYYRLADSLFHTVVPRSEFAIIHETTNGPFRRDETEFAAWAPAENDVLASKRYVEEITQKAKQWQMRG